MRSDNARYSADPVDLGSTGTAVHFLADHSLRAAGSLSAGELVRLARRPGLSVEVDDRRAAPGTTSPPQ